MAADVPRCSNAASLFGWRWARRPRRCDWGESAMAAGRWEGGMVRCHAPSNATTCEIRSGWRRGEMSLPVGAATASPALFEFFAVSGLFWFGGLG